MFFLSKLTLQDYIDNLNNVFNFCSNLISISQDEILIDDTFFLSLDENKLFNICNSLQIEYIKDNKKKTIFNIIDVLFGYETKKQQIRKSI